MITIKYHIILFLVLSLGLPQTLSFPRHDKRPPRNQPSQILYQRIRRVFNLFRQTSSITRLPNSALNPPSLGTPYLTINISWDLPVPLSSDPFLLLDENRGEVDTSISFGSFAFGPGCNDTFSLSAIDFSGDDVYAPGWEAYLVTYPLPLRSDNTIVSSTAEPEPESESEPGLDISSTINIHATRKSVFSSNVYVNVDLFDAKGKLISNDKISFEQVPPANGTCAAALVPIAKLLVTDFSTFELTEEELNFSPTISPEPQETTEPGEEPEPSIEEELSFPPTLSASYMFVNFSWANGITDLESGFEMSQLFPDVFSTCSVSPYVITSGNSFQSTGFETFTINFETLRENDVWNTTDTVITLLAGWWSTIPSTSKVKIDIYMIPPFGEPVGDIFTINLSDPSLQISTCTPIAPIAEVYVNYFETNNSHVISKVEQLELPILPTSSPEEEEDEEDLEPSSPPSAPNLLPTLLNTTSLLINMTWSSTRTDIESGFQISFLNNNLLSTCSVSSFSPYIFTSGNSFSFIGTESFLIDLGKFRGEGVWTTLSATLIMYADWFRIKDPDGTTSINAFLNGPEGEVIGDKLNIDNLSPGLTNVCSPNTVVAAVDVIFNPQTASYLLENLRTEDFPILSPNSEEEEEDASAEPSFESSVPPEIVDEQLLVVTFSWPSDQSDLDSAVRVASITRGVSCFDGRLVAQPIILFSGDSSDFGGYESYIVRIGLAQSYGYWINNLDVDLSGFWYSRPGFNGSEATIAVELKNENDVSLDKLEKRFNPFVSNFVNENGTSFCAFNKVGRIRVSDINGTLAMDFDIY